MGIKAENEDDKIANIPADAANPEEQDALGGEGKGQEQAQADADDEVEIVVSGEEPQPEQEGNRGLGRRARRLLEQKKQLSNENEALEAQNRLLQMQLEKMGQGGKKKPAEAPTMAACGYDEGEYQKAMAEYLSTNSRSVFSEELDRLQKQSQQEAAQQSRRQMLEGHYKRADELKVKDYDDAEAEALKVLGRDVVEDIAATIEESERVLYYLGKNPAKAEEIKHLISSNPVKATFALGKLAAGLEIRPKNKPNSKQPDTPLDGGGSPASANGWEKRLDAARDKAAKSGDMSQVIELKRQARAAGVNL